MKRPLNENKLMMTELFIQTPSQTVGPYFAYGLTSEQYQYSHTQIADGNLIKDEKLKGERIVINGRVFDGEGNIIPDAMIEIWQADADGKYPGPEVKDRFTGFGRQGTGTAADESFLFNTIKPGRVGKAAPHINVIVFMRGLQTHAYTRIYFSDELAANQQDAVLNSVDAKRRITLIAQRTEMGGGIEYRFDIYMQGERETVFFDV